MARFSSAFVVFACLAVAASAAIPTLVRHNGHNHSAEANATNAPIPSPTPTASKNDSGGSSTSSATGKDSSNCFPADATVVTLAGTTKRMDELVAGDRVHVGRGMFSEVFMFTHMFADVAANFVVIDAASSGAHLRLTPGHYMYVNGVLAAAKSVAVGDAIELADGTMDTVAAVSSAVLQGLYNPQTLQGDIVVDHVRVSTYTTAVEPAFAHAALTPLRAAYRYLGISASLFSKGSVLTSVLPSGEVAC
jgi:desert hedgehog